MIYQRDCFYNLKLNFRFNTAREKICHSSFERFSDAFFTAKLLNIIEITALIIRQATNINAKTSITIEFFVFEKASMNTKDIIKKTNPITSLSSNTM